MVYTTLTLLFPICSPLVGWQGDNSKLMSLEKNKWIHQIKSIQMKDFNYKAFERIMECLTHQNTNSYKTAF